MLLEYGFATIISIVTFTIADRWTQAGILSLFATYTYVVLAVFPQ